MKKVSPKEHDGSYYINELETRGVIAFVPSGNSMWPTLKNRGQSVIVEKKKGRLKPFDVAMYLRDSGQLVLHRVLELVEGGYVICGDSQFNTEFVAESNVHGVMTGFYRGKSFIDVNDAEYIKKTEKWYARKIRRKIILKIFFFVVKWKGRAKKLFKIIFCKDEKND